MSFDNLSNERDGWNETWVKWHHHDESTDRRRMNCVVPMRSVDSSWWSHLTRRDLWWSNDKYHKDESTSHFTRLVHLRRLNVYTYIYINHKSQVDSSQITKTSQLISSAQYNTCVCCVVHQSKSVLDFKVKNSYFQMSRKSRPEPIKKSRSFSLFFLIIKSHAVALFAFHYLGSCP